jgi:DNA-binding NtrC family response regulator
MTGLPKRFMVVDDEESIRHSIASFLEDEGYTVLLADSAEKALKILETETVDGAVVDIRLPGKDGNAFMLEAVKIRPEMKFVVHTGSADYTPSEEVRAIGVTHEKVLIKPVSDLNIILNALA